MKKRTTCLILILSILIILTGLSSASAKPTGKVVYASLSQNFASAIGGDHRTIKWLQTWVPLVHEPMILKDLKAKITPALAESLRKLRRFMVVMATPFMFNRTAPFRSRTPGYTNPRRERGSRAPRALSASLSHRVTTNGLVVNLPAFYFGKRIGSSGSVCECCSSRSQYPSPSPSSSRHSRHSACFVVRMADPPVAVTSHRRSPGC